MGMVMDAFGMVGGEAEDRAGSHYHLDDNGTKYLVV